MPWGSSYGSWWNGLENYAKGNSLKCSSLMHYRQQDYPNPVQAETQVVNLPFMLFSIILTLKPFISLMPPMFLLFSKAHSPSEYSRIVSPLFHTTDRSPVKLCWWWINFFQLRILLKGTLWVCQWELCF